MDWLVKWFLDGKEKLSRDILARENKPRKSLPVLSSVEEVNTYLHKNFIYTGDGPRIAWNSVLNKFIGIGLPDYYNHPEVFQAALENGTLESMDWDCDDNALVAYQMLKPLVDNGHIRCRHITNLVADYFSWTSTFPFVYYPSHVICTLERWDHDLQRYRVGVIDTNTSANNRVLWFDNIEGVRVYFGVLYATEYTVYDVRYPFNE